MTWKSALRVSTFVLLAAGLAPQTCAADSVWWEAETPTKTSFPAKTWFAPANAAERELLSDGAWLTHAGKRGGGAPPFARYNVVVPADGEYSFWCRKYWKHGPFRWRFGETSWRQVDANVALADNATLRTHVSVNWVSLGPVKLAKGRHVFELELTAPPGAELTAGFDCFLLTTEAFNPNGKLKPGERLTRAEPGFFAYSPPRDRFAPDALLDLRHLNEKVAGESGFLRRDGNNLVLGNGKPVRFWAVNVGPNNINQDRASVDYLARRLAKVGVNMVRIHGTPFQRNDSAEIERYLDNLFYLTAALKREGIYSAISFYFPVWFDMGRQNGFAGFDAITNKKPFTLLYFDPRFQETYRSWAKRLLDTKNPYTGLTLARDPAVGMVEIINEDSFFFHTFKKGNVPPQYWRELEALFGHYLKHRYGSLEQAFARWGNLRLPDDDSQAGVVALYNAWDMTAAGINQGGTKKAARVGDQVRFLTDQQRGFYAAISDYFRKELHVGGLVSASNWTTADPAMLDALERYTYTAADVIDRHGYFGGEHQGDGAGYSVRVGHAYKDLAAVLTPEELPIQVQQVEGFPQIISEIGWPNPNRFRADAAFLSAAYGALQGVDGIFFFAVGSNNLVDSDMKKFAVATPVIAGAFPATALLYRRGDVREPAPAIRQALDLEDLFAMKGSGSASAQALDDLRKQDIRENAAGSTTTVDTFDPLAFYVGPFVRTFDKDAKSAQIDFTKYIDRDRKIVRSSTNELTWDYAIGLARINTPRTQGAAGFLKSSGRIELDHVTIESANEFGSILVTALDDQPLPSSKKILIQAVTEEKPFGFQAPGGKITTLGSAPLTMRKISAKLSLKLAGDGKATAVALDENGYARSPWAELKQRANGAFDLDLPEDALYHVIQR